MSGYWNSRLHDAIRNGASAPNPDTRQMYRKLAAHYQALRDLSARRVPDSAVQRRGCYHSPSHAIGFAKNCD